MKNSMNSVNKLCDILKSYEAEYTLCEGRISSTEPVRISIAGTAVNADGGKVRVVDGLSLRAGGTVILMISKKTGSVYILGVLA